MASVLVAYATGTGQTEKTAAFVADVLGERNHDVTLHDLEGDGEVDPTAFDAIVVGSPVNNNHHLPAVVKFVADSRGVLADHPSAFFQLSFAAAVDARWARTGSAEWVTQLVSKTGWEPDRVGNFAGTVAYTKYDRVTTLVFKLFSAITTGDTDTSRDYEYTDWTEVEAFALEFAALLEADGGQTVPAEFALPVTARTERATAGSGASSTTSDRPSATVTSSRKTPGADGTTSETDGSLNAARTAVAIGIVATLLVVALVLVRSRRSDR